jgi:hypothetical protein
MQNIYSMPIQAVPGDELTLLVENQGRVNYGSGINDFKVKRMTMEIANKWFGVVHIIIF